MKSKSTGGLVYSTDSGRMCPACRRPVADCVCGLPATAPAGDGIVRVSINRLRDLLDRYYEDEGARAALRFADLAADSSLLVHERELDVLRSLSELPDTIATASAFAATFFGLAAMYASMDAHFLAVLQVLVYAGAIMTLFVFVVMVLNQILGRDLIPVLAPVAAAADGGTFNVNADTFAGAIAGALKAKRLLLLTDVTGVLDKSKSLIAELSVADARKLIAFLKAMEFSTLTRRVAEYSQIDPANIEASADNKGAAAAAPAYVSSQQCSQDCNGNIDCILHCPTSNAASTSSWHSTWTARCSMPTSW